MAQGDNLIIAKDWESDPLLVEIRRRFTYAQNEWRDIREEARKDMRVVAGDPWDPKDKRQRIDAGRPALSLDEIGQYTNQLVNDVRQHQRAIQVTPVGDGANDATAEFRQDLIRQIEYHSKAQDAYTCGFENAVNRSYGFWRVASRYVTNRLTTDTQGALSASLLDQELVIEPIVNPDLVLVDPDFQRPDGSDMKWAFEYERWPVAEYQRQWPDAVVRDASPELARAYPAWFQPESIQVAGYWSIEHETTTVYAVTGPDGSFQVKEAASDRDIPKAKDLPKGSKLKVRDVQMPKVKKRLTNGLEILESQDWPGSQIPIICNFGKILYVDEGSGPKRQILSLVRLARDPYMLYCYYRTCEAELVGMTPKFPYFVRRGSLKPKELDNLQKSLSEPIAVVQVEATTDQNGQMPEFPERQPYEPPIQALEVGAESARRAIQAAMGSMPLPTQAQRQNEKSGVALDKIRDTTQQGTYHFIDHYEQAITRTGVILEELIPHFYDTPRTVAVRKANGEVTQRRINDIPQPDQDGEPIDIDEADHNVTLSTGPSYQSERVAADEFTDSLVEQLPNLVNVIGPQAAAKIFGKAIKMRNLGPIGDEMAEIVSPPDPSGLPPQITQHLQQLMQENQQLKQEIATGTAKIQAKGQADVMVAQAKKQLDQQPSASDIVKLKIADMTSGRSAQAGLAEAEVKAGNADADRRIQLLELMLNLEKEYRLAASAHLADRHAQVESQTHEILGKALDHAHDHALEAHQHDNALAQTAATAALQPPEAGENAGA